MMITSARHGNRYAAKPDFNAPLKSSIINALGDGFFAQCQLGNVPKQIASMTGKASRAVCPAGAGVQALEQVSWVTSTLGITGYGFLFVFNMPAAINAASSSSILFHNEADPNAQRITLGGYSSFLTNEIITIQSGIYYKTSWCSASDSISAGTHAIAAIWIAEENKYGIFLDGVRKPTTYGTATGDCSLLTALPALRWMMTWATATQFSGVFLHSALFARPVAPRQAEEWTSRPFSIYQSPNSPLFFGSAAERRRNRLLLAMM